MKNRLIVSLCVVGLGLGFLGGCGGASSADTKYPLSPSQVYGDLFVAVQTAQIYPDQKVFVDAQPKDDPEAIVRRYHQQKDEPGFSLARFANQYFIPPADQGIVPPPNQSLRDHIDWLWPALTRDTPSVPAYSSLLALPYPYVVPGGRFREGYYWDTYFTMLGLQESGHEDLVDDMLDNFAYLIDKYGHIPNGNRSYYLSRSQPPFFSCMVALAATVEGNRVYQKYLPAMRSEYAYWMRGASTLRPGQAKRNVVMLSDGTVLNRYWDALSIPRDESYLEDVRTAQQVSNRPAADVYRDLRAAAESGWDFSSRWLGDGKTLATIRTTAIIPVDLNSLMFHLEATIAYACGVSGDTGCVSDFSARANQRAVAIDTYLWNSNGYYGDYDWQLQQSRNVPSAAMFYPLFVGVATPQRASQTARQAQTLLLKMGGLDTTTTNTGQQWDAPNGWAPLQWIAIQGLDRYGQTELAQQIGSRFLSNVEQFYASKQKLVEKYDVEGDSSGSGGEYPLQDGFGWTNGVVLKLLDLAKPQ